MSSKYRKRTMAFDPPAVCLSEPDHNRQPMPGDTSGLTTTGAFVTPLGVSGTWYYQLTAVLPPGDVLWQWTDLSDPLEPSISFQWAQSTGVLLCQVSLTAPGGEGVSFSASAGGYSGPRPFDTGDISLQPSQPTTGSGTMRVLCQ